MDGKLDPEVKVDSTHVISSCCKDSPPECLISAAYNEGCGEKLADNLSAILKAIGIVAVIFGAIEVRLKYKIK